MQRKTSVLLLGTDSSVASVLRRYHHEYTILWQEGSSPRMPVDDEPLPDMIVLSINAVHFCQLARQAWPTLPILVISPDKREQRIASVLDLGADDYVVVPFGEHELLARMRALLRRRPQEPRHNVSRRPDPLTTDDGYLSLHIERHQVFLAGQEIHLTCTEFNVLHVLIEHKNKTLTHRFLLQHVWGPEYGEEVDYLRVYIRQLRRKIEADPSHPRYLLTDMGNGYLFHDPDVRAKTEEHERNELNGPAF